MKRYFWNILVWLDQGLNTFAAGDPDETVSSRCGKRQNCRFCAMLCAILDRVDPRHCARNIEQDEGKDAVIK